MEQLTFTGFQTTIVVILAIFSALTVIDKGAGAFRSLFLKGGDGLEKRVRLIEDKQDRDAGRLNDMDKQMRRVNNDTEHMLNAMNAILMHEITGNGVEKLKEAKMDLDAYMSRRGSAVYAAKGDAM